MVTGKKIYLFHQVFSDQVILDVYIVTNETKSRYMVYDTTQSNTRRHFFVKGSQVPIGETKEEAAMLFRKQLDMKEDAALRELTDAFKMREAVERMLVDQQSKE